MRILAVACAGMLPLLAGCDHPIAMPTSPAPIQGSTIPSPGAPRVSVAQLELLNGSVRGNAVAFLLKETSGRSSAVIQSVHAADDSGIVSVTDNRCWGPGVVIRVPAGGTFDGFDGRFANQDLRPDPYDYCGPYSAGSTSQVRVTVIFTDEDGTIGTVTARIPTT